VTRLLISAFSVLMYRNSYQSRNSSDLGVSDAACSTNHTNMLNSTNLLLDTPQILMLWTRLLPCTDAVMTAILTTQFFCCYLWSNPLLTYLCVVQLESCSRETKTVTRYHMLATKHGVLIGDRIYFTVMTCNDNESQHCSYSTY
jgi:hypothetical protein